MMTQLKKNLLFFVLFCAFLWPMMNCSRLRYDVIPDADAVYHALNLKVNVKVENENSRQRQNFKIVLKYDENMDKMLFLSPLNQVYGQLFIKNERVVLINTKKKRYWKGRFKRLIKEIWALDFDYSEFRALILEGHIPRDKAKESGLRISLEKEKESERPVRIKIKYRDVLLSLKVSGRRIGEGRIDFSPRLEKAKKESLERVLEE